jgi:hypothetical protein
LIAFGLLFFSDVSMNVRVVTGGGEVGNLCRMDLSIDGFAEPLEAVRAVKRFRGAARRSFVLLSSF